MSCSTATGMGHLIDLMMLNRPLYEAYLKVFKRQLSGLRDMEYFKLRLFFIHEDPLTLAG